MIGGESEADESGAAMAGEAPQSPRSEAGHVSGGWQDPHIPPPGARVVELVRVRSVAEVKRDFFHVDRNSGKTVGRFMSAEENAESGGVNTKRYKTIEARAGETVVLMAERGGRKVVIGVLYGGTRARVVATPARACTMRVPA